MGKTATILGNVVDILASRIYYSELQVASGKIVSKQELGPEKKGERYIMPGFIDSHVHVESSMLIPSEFARLAVVHGTVATISDPHEIANVCGMAGVEFMIDNGKQVPFKFHFGAPSCVPATTFETAGATLDSNDVRRLLERNEIHYLSEMMNFPGVLYKDEKVWKKIQAAKDLGKPVDGHAPGLRGEQAKQYIDAGISTDHECFTSEEALDKLQHGMKILIREGSAARNFDALIGLMNDHADMMMFCSDDKHPDSLEVGHINSLCKRAVEKGVDVFKVLKAACINPVQHYSMKVGQLQVGDDADFIVVNNLADFVVHQTYIGGRLVAEDGKTFISPVATKPINNFDCEPVTEEELSIHEENFPLQNGKVPVIEALDGQLITNIVHVEKETLMKNGFLVSNVDQDLLKIVVVNRYRQASPAIGFIKNFKFRHGAIASSVAHDSHNIIAVGADDESIATAINLVIKEKGGVSCTDGNKHEVLGLPVAGLMSNLDGYTVAKAYTSIDAMAKNLGSTLGAPFMTLSFMALLVIPHLKMSDLGLFDGDSFAFLKQGNQTASAG